MALSSCGRDRGLREKCVPWMDYAKRLRDNRQGIQLTDMHVIMPIAELAYRRAALLGGTQVLSGCKRNTSITNLCIVCNVRDLHFMHAMSKRYCIDSKQ